MSNLVECTHTYNGVPVKITARYNYGLDPANVEVYDPQQGQYMIAPTKELKLLSKASIIKVELDVVKKDSTEKEPKKHTPKKKVETKKEKKSEPKKAEKKKTIKKEDVSERIGAFLTEHE